jgi:molybdopterin/thiamine biosynthesis adenylyltransferase/rhodanese-related sulfurtransferase
MHIELIWEHLNISLSGKLLLGCVDEKTYPSGRKRTFVMELSSEELERYSRHLRIPGFGHEQQERLKNGSVLVIGLGGLGSPAAMYLASAGVGRIGLADFDRVEVHNLQRQILYSEDDVGSKKLHAAQKRINQINRSVRVELHEQGVTKENIRSLLQNYEVVLDGSDNFDTRYLVNDASYLERTPLVYGSVFRLEGQIMVLNHGENAPCYRCLFPDPPKPGTIPDCNEAGVIGALCGVVGSLQAMEVIKLLSGMGNVMSGVLTKIDLLANRFPVIKLPKDPSCPLCGAQASIHDLHSQPYAVPCALPDVEPIKDMDLEIDVLSAAELRSRNDVVFLDVREPQELEICKLEGSLDIPMGAIPERLSFIPRDKALVVVCHHGYRSLRVVHYLRQSGFATCTSLRGGVAAWAEQVDPSMARY